MPIFSHTFPFLILFKRIESIDMTLCVISFLVYSGRIRTLVAMASYSSHRLISEKWKLTISAKSLGIFEKFFTEIFIE